ncbi:protein FAM117A isoform X2 [Elgaria multicarinata webbii]|uniref:protein FAM117A isoform X2 n=1 Tax=Elgaria multicarinata webbii TaxID=159646 RepID=UPI002FCD5AC0
MAAGTSSCCRGGLQPLKATVPFQLQHRRNGDGGRAASVPCATGQVEKACRNRPPRVRRTSSLDTILGSYLLGQWPRDAEGAAAAHMSDKSTQTPVSWHETEAGKAPVHKRSASWSSMDHRREIAKLKQQLQRTKLTAWGGKDKDRSSPVQGDHGVLPSAKILDIPDGHRAPPPLQRGPRESLLLQLEHSSCSSSLSLSPSPSAAVGRSLQTPARAVTEELTPGVLENPGLEAKGKENGNTSPVLAFALSPRPNHTYVFKREPPEGCEKIRAFEEVAPLSPDQPFLPSCPDKNKVHFNPTGSAFCRFSLVKPLNPNVDFLFRDFSSSPSPMPPGTFSSCPPTSALPVLGLRKDSTGDNFSESPKSPPLNLESWKRHQAEDAVLFHSSLIV